MKKYQNTLLVALLFIASITCAWAQPLLTYEGSEGIGKGKHIVLIANDHEYRSEETCPALAKILAKHYGFKCTVLFGVDDAGHIKAGDEPIQGIEALKEADLLFFFTRFMNLPDEQVDILADYFEKGGPVVGVRTSTHAFNKQAGKWAKLNFNYEGEDYRGGLGENIFGNTWHKDRGQSHYGSNHKQGSKLIAISESSDHPILTGIKQLHAYSGAYSSKLPKGATPLLEVQVLNTFEPSDEIAANKPLVNAGWARNHYIAPSGTKKDARVVYTSFGASEDLIDANSRRFLVNACLWAAGMESDIKADSDVSLVGDFSPSPYFGASLYRTGVSPTDLAGWDSPVMPATAPLKGLDQPSARLGRAFENRPKFVASIKENFPDFDIENFKAQPKKKTKKK